MDVPERESLAFTVAWAFFVLQSFVANLATVVVRSHPHVDIDTFYDVIFFLLTDVVRTISRKAEIEVL